MNPASRPLLCLAAGLLCSALLAAAVLSPGRAVPADATFIVDTTTDIHDAVPGDGVCSNGVDGCSLRAAIEEAFYTSDSTSITFGPRVAGSTFYFNNDETSGYGTIVWSASNTTLDGGRNSIYLSGSGLGAGQSLLRIQGSGNTLKDLTLHTIPGSAVEVGDYAWTGAGSSNTLQSLIIYGAGSDAVYIFAGSYGGGVSNSLYMVQIGASAPTYTACVPGEGAGGDGVHIEKGANDTSIISSGIFCSAGYGVHINGSGGSPGSTFLHWNGIGARENVALGNSLGGVLAVQDTHTVLRENLVSGNGGHGVHLSGSTYAVLHANLIGTSWGGDTAVANTGCGVEISDGAHANDIGGSSPTTDRNVISGNGQDGVCIISGAYDNLVDSNLIGLSRAGTAALPNGLAGVAVIHAGAQQIGSDAMGADQYISCNSSDGIYIEGSNGVLVGRSTWIGQKTDYASCGNNSDGVRLVGASGSRVAPVSITANLGSGIGIFGNDALHNALLPVHNDDNGGLPIDLGDDGPTPNGAHSPPGPNNWLPYPLIISARGRQVAGTACSGCMVAVYNSTSDPRAVGGGGLYLGSTMADASGHWSFNVPTAYPTSGISAVACANTCATPNDTSEMSPMLHLAFIPFTRRR